MAFYRYRDHGHGGQLPGSEETHRGRQTSAPSLVSVSDCLWRSTGTGTMVMAVSYPAQRKPIVVGKPQPPMFEELKKVHNLDPDRCLMVGDRSVNRVHLPASCLR